MEAEGLSQSIGTSINCTGGTGDRKGAARRSNRLSIARGEEADQDHEDQVHLNVIICLICAQMMMVHGQLQINGMRAAVQPTKRGKY